MAQSDDWMAYVLPAVGFLLGAVLTWIVMGFSHRSKVSRLDEKLTTALEGTDEARQRLAISQREIDTHRANESRLLLQQKDLEDQLKLERQRMKEGLADVFKEPKKEGNVVTGEKEKSANTLKLTKKDQESVSEIFASRAQIAKNQQLSSTIDELQTTKDKETRTPVRVKATMVTPEKDADGFVPVTPLPQPVSPPVAPSSLMPASLPSVPLAVSPDLPQPGSDGFEGFEADDIQEKPLSLSSDIPDFKGAAEELRRALKKT